MSASAASNAGSDDDVFPQVNNNPEEDRQHQQQEPMVVDQVDDSILDATTSDEESELQQQRHEIENLCNNIEDSLEINNDKNVGKAKDSEKSGWVVLLFTICWVFFSVQTFFGNSFTLFWNQTYLE